MPHSTLEELELLIRSRYGLIILDTFEESRAEEMLKHISSRLSLHFFAWTRTKGLRRGASFGDPPIDGTAEPAKALAQIEREGPGIYHFTGLGAYLDDALVTGHARDAVGRFALQRGALVITGHDVRLPDSLRPHATTIRLPAPEPEAYRALLDRLIREYSARMPVKVELSPQDRLRLLNNLAGLTLIEAEKILTRLIIEDGSLRPDDVARVIAAKRQVVEQDGLLEYYPAEHSMTDVAGLEGLKDWLGKRRAIVADPARASAFGLSFPKGVLLLGVPGCGKSLCAKAVAREWGLPLLKLDPANLYDKYVGDSEKNFKRAKVFFVDLPKAEARRAIFEIHLKKRKQPVERFDVAALAHAADGFSGAEMEQAIASGLYTAFARNAPLSSDIVLQEIAATRPLSQTMAERLDALREWGTERWGRTRSLRLRLAAPAGRREVDHQRDDEAHDRPERPFTAEPVLHCRVPQQRGRKEDQPDDREQERVEHATEPRSEEPEDDHHEARRE